ncbi:hypothetical protein D3C73_575230 [compost metagenome]
MNKLLAQIARLTSSITLKPDQVGKLPAYQFIAGRGAPFSIFSGPGLAWWKTKDSTRAMEALIGMLISSSPEFIDCDTESVNKIIHETLQQICLDSPLFNGDDVVFATKENLFECKGAVTVQEFCEIILAEIKKNLRNIIGERCTIHPLPRFKGPSLSLPSERLHLIACDDPTAWDMILEKQYNLDGWSPNSPFTKSSGFGFNSIENYNYILFAEEHGTQKGAKFSSSIKFRMMTAVIFAFASEAYPYRYHKSIAQPFTTCLQFPHRNFKNTNIHSSDCGALSPFFTSDIELSVDLLNNVELWYTSLNACPKEYKQRILKSAHFLNRGMNADDIESYINYFVALDALFGSAAP